MLECSESMTSCCFSLSPLVYLDVGDLNIFAFQRCHVHADMCKPLFLCNLICPFLWICVCSISADSTPNETTYSPTQEEPANSLISFLTAFEKPVFPETVTANSFCLC